MAWSTPKTDWDTNPKSPMAEDFNRIEENIDFLNNDIETKKGLIVDAVSDLGRDVTLESTHQQLADALIEPNLVPANIKSGVNIFGKVGTLIPVDSITFTVGQTVTVSGTSGTPTIHTLTMPANINCMLILTTDYKSSANAHDFGALSLCRVYQRGSAPRDLVTKGSNIIIEAETETSVSLYTNYARTSDGCKISRIDLW